MDNISKGDQHRILPFFICGPIVLKFVKYNMLHQTSNRMIEPIFEGFCYVFLCRAIFRAKTLYTSTFFKFPIPFPLYMEVKVCINAYFALKIIIWKRTLQHLTYLARIPSNKYNLCII